MRLQQFLKSLRSSLESPRLWAGLGFLVAVAWLASDFLDLATPASLPVALLIAGVAFLILLGAQILDSQTETLATVRAASPVEVIAGNEAVYGKAADLVRAVPKGDSLHAASIWRRALGDAQPSPAAKQFSEEVIRSVSRGVHLFRAMSDPGGANARASQVSELAQLAALPGSGAWQVQFYDANPIAIAILIGEKQAMIGFPSDQAARNLESALLITDESAVKALRRWYEHHIWHLKGPEAGREIRSVADYEAAIR